MAFVVYKSGKRGVIEHDKSLQVWAVMNGEVPATERQQAYVDSIERLFLAWTTAPESYKRAYPRQQPGSVTYDAPVRRDLE